MLGSTFKFLSLFSSRRFWGPQGGIPYYPFSWKPARQRRHPFCETEKRSDGNLNRRPLGHQASVKTARPWCPPYMMLKNKNSTTETNFVMVGKEKVTLSKSFKLLVMVIEETQLWNKHFFGLKGLITSLHQRTFAISSQFIQENEVAMQHSLSRIG